MYLAEKGTNFSKADKWNYILIMINFFGTECTYYMLKTLFFRC